MTTVRQWLVLFTVCLLGCEGETAFRPELQHSDRTPWTHTRFCNDPGTFRFAIIGDLAGGFRPEVFREAVTRLNDLQPEFVMSVGDLIEGWDDDRETYIEDRETIDSRWDGFAEAIDELQVPLFRIGGNNDFGTPELERAWLDRFTATYYSFLYRDALFIVLDSDDPPGSSQGQLSDVQLDWLSATLDRHRDVGWTFLFLHRPLWIDTASEWQRVQELLGDRRRTVFSGHHHAYKVSTIDGIDHYTLATTGGSSSLSGPASGRFDHLVWVTVTGDGPRVANLMLDGVWGDNPVAEAVGENELTTMIRSQGLAPALRAYEKLRREDPSIALFDDEAMRELGYDLMTQERLDDALQVLSLNAEAHPDSAAAYSYLAEVYKRREENDRVVESCRKALDLDPENSHARNLMAEMSK